MINWSTLLKKFMQTYIVIVSGIDCKTVRIFAYSSTLEKSNKRSGTRLKTESETGETLTPRSTNFFTDFEKKNDCFSAVYLWEYSKRSHCSFEWHLTSHMSLSIETCIRRTPCIKRKLQLSPRVSAWYRFHCIGLKCLIIKRSTSWVLPLYWL